MLVRFFDQNNLELCTVLIRYEYPGKILRVFLFLVNSIFAELVRFQKTFYSDYNLLSNYQHN